MVMAAKFHTETEIKIVRAKAVKISADGVKNFTMISVPNSERFFHLQTPSEIRSRVNFRDIELKRSACFLTS